METVLAKKQRLYAMINLNQYIWRDACSMSVHGGQTKEIGMSLHTWRLHETQSKWPTDRYELIIMEGFCNVAKTPARCSFIVAKYK